MNTLPAISLAVPASSGGSSAYHDRPGACRRILRRRSGGPAKRGKEFNGGRGPLGICSRKPLITSLIQAFAHPNAAARSRGPHSVVHTSEPPPPCRCLPASRENTDAPKGCAHQASPPNPATERQYRGNSTPGPGSHALGFKGRRVANLTTPAPESSDRTLHSPWSSRGNRHSFARLHEHESHHPPIRRGNPSPGGSGSGED